MKNQQQYLNQIGAMGMYPPNFAAVRSISSSFYFCKDGICSSISSADTLKCSSFSVHIEYSEKQIYCDLMQHKVHFSEKQ